MRDKKQKKQVSKLVLSPPEVRGNKMADIKKILLTLVFIMLTPLLSGSLFAEDNISFNDNDWKWFDRDHSHDTEKHITSDSQMEITAGGMDVWTSSDEYASYYLRNIEGDFVAYVKIVSQDNSNSWAKAGLMIKNDISKNAESQGYAIMAVTPGNGYVFQWDSTPNGRLNQNANQDTSTYECWLALQKEGTSIRGYYKKNLEDTWTELRNQTINSIATIQDIGIFVSAHNSNDLCTVVFQDFKISKTASVVTHTLTASAGENGAISPSGELEITENDSQTFTITPDAGYEIETVKIDGSEITFTGTDYTFESVTAAHSIYTSFSLLSYTISATTGDNGSISPSGDTTVLHGNSQTYEVTPAIGYEVDTVTVDGEAVELINNQYTFSNITQNRSIHASFKALPPDPGGDISTIAGCGTNTSEDYSEGFNLSDFDLNNMNISEGKIVLSTGNDAIDPDNVVIPFEQEISVTFLYEGAGYVSDFGWMLKSDAVNEYGVYKGWNNIPSSAKHPVFRNIKDDSEGEGGNGILDSDSGLGSMPTTNESSLASYNDGTEYPFTVDGDGSVTSKDMKKTLGTFAAGSEIIFFLTADKDWTTTDTSGVFFNKKEWNTDTYGACGSGTFNKIYHLDVPSNESGCTTDGGWLAERARERLDSIFDITLSGTYELPITVNQNYAHVIVGAPDNDPDQWILGWEDLTGAGDADHNDMVFKIHRKTGGVAELKTTEAIEPDNEASYYTAVNFEVWDNMPCSGTTEISYFVSIDNGTNWVEITEWDRIHESDTSKTIGAQVTSWTSGTPQYTYRSRRIDFAGMDLYGRAIVWKSVMQSDDPACVPEILGVTLEGEVSTNGSFSRGEPVVVANVLYSGSYETPAMSWTDKVQRGHLFATRLYSPDTPTETNESIIWDAGAVLSNASPDSRNIYFPNVTAYSVSDEVLATGDGTTVTFTGTLAHYPVSATTLEITDQTETFTDKHTDELEGSFNGTGTINRFTGVYSITFNSPPGNDVEIKADYSYYTTSNTLSSFNTTNISSSMLALDNTYVIGNGFKYDFNGDNKYNGVDKDGNGTQDDSDGDWLVQWIRGYKDGSSAATKKEWLLGPIDHSVPAVATPPGKPEWYYGIDIPISEKAAYDLFRTANLERQSVIFIGSRDGMLHAFDAGKFRWGDNPDTTNITENHGYFLWESDVPNYGSGSELWAFIPANLIPRLKNNKMSGEDRSFVDASPALADVYVDIGDGNGTKWRTVLLCAEGNGGDTVFALDVTDPANPFFLWEFADPDLFRSRSSPALAQIGRIVSDGTAKWVAFFVSGKSYNNTLYPSVYMIDISDGSVLNRIYLNAVSGGVGGVPSGQPAIIDADGNGFIDRLYIGTDKGYMYKVNIPDSPGEVKYSITQSVINTDFTDDDGVSVPLAQQYHPIYASPAVVVERTLNHEGQISSVVQIFFGTGDSPYYDEDINTAETTYHFFAYLDDTENGNSEEGAVTLDWFYTLPASHRVFASAFAAAGQIYFGTSTSETEDPCAISNEGKLMVLDMNDGDLVTSVSTGNVYSSPLVEDQHLYLKTTEGLKSYGDGNYNNAQKTEGESSISTRMWREINE